MGGSATRQALERRSERRIRVRLPMQARASDRHSVPFEEITQSENVSGSGAAFATVHELDPGTDVQITVLPRQGRESETDFVTRGRVVHVRPGKSKNERIVGVEFTGPRFHRVFHPEPPA